MIIIKKLIDYIFFSRPILFFPAWTSFLLFIILSNQPFLIGEVISIMVLMAITMAAGFIINQIYDIESDKINEKCFYLYDQIISINEAKILSIVLLTISIIFSFTFNMTIIIVNLLSFISGIVYSFKPFGLKDRLYGNIITQFSMGILATSYALIPNKENIILLLIYNLVNLVLCLLTTIPDVTGDKKINKITLAVKYGELNVARIGLIILIIALGLSTVYIDAVLLSFIICVFILTYILYFAFTKFKVEYLIKINLLIQALVTAYYFNFYITLIVLMYFLGRIYFKRRFNIHYPQLFQE